MRISDWSSDVCSSDLREPIVRTRSPAHVLTGSSRGSPSKETSRRKGIPLKSIKSLLLGSVAMSFCAAAQAQEAAPGSDDQGAIVVTGTYTLDHSIDTATGLGLALREPPQSVSVMTAQRILDQNLITVKDVTQTGVGGARRGE